jgi:hypothetical protein
MNRFVDIIPTGLIPFVNKKVLFFVIRSKFGRKWFVPDIGKEERIPAKAIPADL